jgi:hypothetical protein
MVAPWLFASLRKSVDACAVSTTHRVAVYSVDQLKVYDIRSGRQMWTAAVSSTAYRTVTKIAFSHDGQTLVMFYAHQLHVFHAETGHCLWQARYLAVGRPNVRFVRFISDGRLAVGSDKLITIYDHKGKTSDVVCFDGARDCAICGLRLAIAHATGVAVLHRQFAPLSSSSEYEMFRSPSPVVSVACSADARRLACIDEHVMLSVFDVCRRARIYASNLLPGHYRTLECTCAFAGTDTVGAVIPAGFLFQLDIDRQAMRTISCGGLGPVKTAMSADARTVVASYDNDGFVSCFCLADMDERILLLAARNTPGEICQQIQSLLMLGPLPARLVSFR